ncbi:MAG: tRNA pseudouridine(38-40) synthase TruA [Flavobacteriaceae bacterium]|nr:tRNA pseudouridine(38-40) synthase TruA [Flavobacteriaceae bacterium]
MRYFLEIAYNGTHYHGWQKQPNALSVQEVLEQKLSIFFREEVTIMGAGRTDAGVHAKQLFAHFEVAEIQDIPKVVYQLNSFLPRDISVHNIHLVKNDAHVRFDATSREYEYLISLQKNPFQQKLAYQMYQEPDVTLMNQAAEILLQYSDFQCFSRSNTDVKTYLCEVTKAIWELEDSQLKFTITANRFLRNMVRAIVGTLLDVGFGKITLENVHEIIKSKDRGKAGPSAPAHGLYLTKVCYPPTMFVNK